MRLLLVFLLFVPVVAAQNIMVGFKSRPRSVPHLIREIGDLNVYLVRREALTVLQHNPHVEFIEQDMLVAPSVVPNDPLYTNLSSWAFTAISASAAWDVTTGSAVTIAVLDTGLDPLHPDLGQTVTGWNVFDGNADTADVHGHGTAMALVAAAASNNTVGNASICWSCQVMPVRISDLLGNATFSAAADGINYARTHGAKIVSLSYEMTGSQTVSRAAKRFQQDGGLVVVSAGNGGQYRCCDDSYIFTVGATDQFDQIATYSNYGPQVDLNAPGHWLQLCKVGIVYVNCGSDGTSNAAPEIAAAAALLWTLQPLLTPTQMQAKLKSTADSARLNLYRLLTE